MPQYHFDLGNSSSGPVGFCARITAETEEAALERLQGIMPEVVEIWDGDEDGEYLCVYLNPDAVTAADIDDVDD